ncbi:MAG: Acetyl-CoA carboxylase, biotin carboxyl carrier protein [Pseudomonadota bacterium]|jgi:acetyl-CoA carboxylase biotin carboxyl carrier protein
MAARKKGQADGTAPFGATSLDVEALRRIVEILEGSEVSHLSWTNGDERLVIRRGPQGAVTVVEQSAPAVVRPAVAAAPAPAAASASAAAPAAKAEAAGAEKPGTVVTSPFVGTFYRTPAPDQPPFVEAGSVVKKGQVLCIVEAMKLMNEIESETAGRISEVLVENGQPVEFGQALFRVEPA